jgi:uncharacterized membrane protein YbaN (DUF454 family)
LKIHKRLIRLIVGWLFIILGVLGCFLPILQGILFLSIGFVLLAPDVPIFKRMMKKIKEKYPAIAEKASEITKKFD